MITGRDRHRLPSAGLVALLAVGMVTAATENPPGFPRLTAPDYTPAAVSAREPMVLIDYPGGALTKGLGTGNAVVSILVGADGKALDSLVIGYSAEPFGTALMDRVPVLSLQPAMFKGAAVPGRFEFGYSFESRRIEMTPAQKAEHMLTDGRGDRLSYHAVAERTLDHPLELTNPTLPRIPVDFTPPNDEPVRVYVTFYVDEQGNARVPNVESACSPKLFPGAVKAVRLWKFTPPTVNGKPVLVLAGRSVGFVPRDIK